jgi:cytochrome c556
MKTRVAILACTIVPFLGSCAPTAPHAGQPTLQGQSMEDMLADVVAVRTFVYGGSNQVEADKAATDLVSWSHRMSELFPPGEAIHDYVDMGPEKLSVAPGAMIRASEALKATVRTGNRTAIGSQLAQTEHDGCGACHLSGSR